MQKLFWIGLIGLLGILVFFTVRFGIRPKPIARINPTTLSRPQEIGAVVYRRLFHLFREEKVIVLGSHPLISGYDRIWRGLFLTAKGDGQAWDLLVEEPDIKDIPALKGMKVISEAWTQNPEFWAARVKEWVGQGKTVVLHTVFQQSTRLIKDSALKKFEKGLGRPVLSISQLPFAVNEQELGGLQPSCPEAGPAAEELAPLGCAAKRVSQKFFRKELATDELIAVLEKHGVKDFLLFVHQPVILDSSESQSAL